MTLNGVLAPSLPYFTEFAFGAHCVKVVEDTPIHSAAGMYHKECSFYRLWRCWRYLQYY